LEYLHSADLQHAQDDLGILGVVLVPTVVQGLACSGQGDRGHQLQVEPSDAEMIHQHAMIITCGLEPDPNRQSVFPQDRNQANEIIPAVGDRQAPPARQSGAPRMIDFFLEAIRSGCPR